MDARPPAMSILGYGWDLTESNFWDYSTMSSSRFFDDKAMKGHWHRCFKESECLHASTAYHSQFHSLASWSRFCMKEMNLKASGSDAESAVTGTVSASLGTTSQNSWKEERNSLFVKLMNRQACFVMRSSCVYNPDYINPAIKALMQQLPQNANDPATLDQWESELIQRYGTHVNVGSEHGAQIKILSTMASQCQESMEALKTSVCGSFSWLEHMDESFCSNTTRTDTSKVCSTQRTSQCVLTGGDPTKSATNLCTSSGSADAVAAMKSFLGSQVEHNGESAIRYEFAPISEILHFMGFYNQAKIMERATRKHECTGLQHRWTGTRCECALDCGVGGTLIPESCACKCKGDAMHGYRGPRCETMYGTCQPGKGTHNEKAANECKVNNVCKNWFHEYHCKAAENCCLTNGGGRCCPVDSACDCSGSGCSCIKLDELRSTANHTVQTVVV